MKAYLKRTLKDPNSQLTSKEKTRDKKLLHWLEDISFHNILAWFGAYENAQVSTAIRNKRWNAETTEQDRRFLSLLKDADLA